MASIPRSTIEQWAVLRAVIDCGGFAPAAERLNRSQSSVSYTVARLQEAAGAQLMEIRGRRAHLTPLGAALLAEAAPLIDDLARIERRGSRAAQGQPESLRLLVDTLFPKPRLFHALRLFAERFPDTGLHLAETVRKSVDQIAPENYDLALLTGTPGARGVDVVAHARMIAVAHADHPLVAGGAVPLGPAALARYPCVEFDQFESHFEPVLASGRRWHMSTVDSAIGAVRAGLCYGWLPQDLIRRQLDDGSLRPLALESGLVREVGIVLVRSELRFDTPAVSDLAELLKGG